MGEDETTVTHVKAISLSYFLDCTEEWQRTAGDQWEKQFLDISMSDLERVAL